MKIFSETPSYGTRLSFAGMSKPLAHGVHAWRQRPTALPVSIGTGVAVGVDSNFAEAILGA